MTDKTPTTNAPLELLQAHRQKLAAGGALVLLAAAALLIWKQVIQTADDA